MNEVCFRCICQPVIAGLYYEERLAKELWRYHQILETAIDCHFRIQKKKVIWNGTVSYLMVYNQWLRLGMADIKWLRRRHCVPQVKLVPMSYWQEAIQMLCESQTAATRVLPWIHHHRYEMIVVSWSTLTVIGLITWTKNSCRFPRFQQKRLSHAQFIRHWQGSFGKVDNSPLARPFPRSHHD